MNFTVILAAATLGLAGMPHCAAMCAPACLALWGSTARGDAPGMTGHRRRMFVFLLGRTLSYAAVGGLAAAGVGALEAWAQVAPWLRPVWAMLHASGLALGLWLWVVGRQPAWMAQWGRTRRLQAPDGEQEAARVTWHGRFTRTPETWAGIGRSGVAGLFWVGWPCGLLQSALLVASLGNSATVGALAMAAFAAVSAVPLGVSARLWERLGQGHSTRFQTLAVRAAGAMLVLGSGFALGRDVWHQVAAYCGF